MFLNKEIAADIRWHKEKHVEEANVLRHPVDGKVWKELLTKFTSHFARDPRNVRLA